MTRLRLALGIGAALAAAAGGCSPGTPATSGGGGSGPTPVVPYVDGPWVQIAGSPDLGALTTATQQPVDFSVWQAADGTWQLWACIRGTRVAGETRLFYRWEGQHLVDGNWTPKGIALEADAKYGETPGGLQAPYVIKVGATYHLFYGDWQHICEATSTDGKTFHRVLNAAGKSALFSEGAGDGTRDPMVLPVGDGYCAYYTANPGGAGADYVRMSSDLKTWGPSTRVAFGGAAGTGPSAAECPFVVYRPEARSYFLFRTQQYGEGARTSVYRSPDPSNFGVNDDRYLVGTLPVAAPEIVEADGESYLATLRPGLDGIQVAHVSWVAATR